MIPGKELLAQFGIEVLGDGKNQTQVLNEYGHDEATVPYIRRKCTHPNSEDNAFVAIFCRSMSSWTDASTQHLLVRALCGPSVKKFVTKIFLHQCVVHSLNNHQKKFSFSK